MANLTSVTLAAGIPTVGTGDVSTLDAVMAILGEVQASPTSNTLLERVKAIKTSVDTGVTTALPAGEAHIGMVGGTTIKQAASSTITRPSDTTAYASGDLVANSVTAGSVAALQFTTLARVSGGSGVILGAAVQKSGNVTTNAQFRIHYFDTIPTFTSAGDNSPLSTVVVASAKGYLGYVDVQTMIAFSDVAWGTGAADNSRGILPFKATAQIIYAIVEARAAYTPASAEVFTIHTFASQD